MKNLEHVTTFAWPDVAELSRAVEGLILSYCDIGSSYLEVGLAV